MNCRSCGGTSFGDVIDLGEMPLVNNLLRRANDPCPRYPLKVVYCKACSLAQLTQTPPPQAMFDDYCYFSSQSQTMVNHARDLVKRFVKSGQRVVEIASNDGYLLRHAQQRGAKVFGIDPARNVAAFANSIGVPTRCEYFNASSAGKILKEFGKADVIFANNVLAHVPEPNEIAAGIKLLLDEQGAAHLEVPYFPSMIESCAFDTIYHEHHCHFSLSALQMLFHRHDLRITDVDLIDIHGGSLHLQIEHQGDEAKSKRLQEGEIRAGIFLDHYYRDFSARVEDLKADLQGALDEFQSVAALGAAAKGVVLLNHFGLDSQRISFVADVSPHKQGRFIPGTRQPIISPQEFLQFRPQAALVLPWNIKAELIGFNQAFADQGGRFIVPIPKVEILPRKTPIMAAALA